MGNLVHGGDIYTFMEKNPEQKPVDFSANINPLGMPDSVKQAVADSVSDCESYPDPLCRQLRRAISKSEDVPEHWIFCGNGAADVLFRLALALRPQKALISAPTFSEYAASLVGIDCAVRLHVCAEADGFAVTERILDDIDNNTDIVYLCNPNNPTGSLTDMVLMKKVLEKCVEVGAILLADECFNDFLCDADFYTLKHEMAEHDNLIILRAFTKLYAMPGIRLGYCMTSNKPLMEKLYVCGQPWNVSVVAQKCGIAALEDMEFPRATRKFITQEREFLTQALENLGFRVFKGHANYIFFQNTIVQNLQSKLEQYGILIRSCANYAGLDCSYFRIAVRTERDNQLLIDTMKKVVGCQKFC